MSTQAHPHRRPIWPKRLVLEKEQFPPPRRMTHQSTPNPHPVLDLPAGAVIVCFRLARLKRCRRLKNRQKPVFRNKATRSAVANKKIKGERIPKPRPQAVLASARRVPPGDALLLSNPPKKSHPQRQRRGGIAAAVWWRKC
jgi:hypothetical protein